MKSNQEILEQVADAFTGEEVKGADLIALVIQAKPEAKASAIFPAAADILSTAPSSAPYRKFLRKVGTGRYLVLPADQRVDGVSAKAKPVAAVPAVPAVADADSPAPTADTTETTSEPVAV